MKKALSSLLVVLMLLSYFPMSAFAADKEIEITITPSITEMSTPSTDTDVTYTVSIKYLDSSVKIGSIDFNLNPGANITLAESGWTYSGGSEFYTENYVSTSKKYTGVLSNYLSEDSTLLTITGKIAAGTTDNVTVGLTNVVVGADDGETELSTKVTVIPTVVQKTVASPIAVTDLEKPIKGGTPDTSATLPTGMSAGTVTWSGSPATFAPNTSYTATIPYTIQSGYVLPVGVTVTEPEGASSATINTAEKTITITYNPTASAGVLGGSVTIDNTSPKFGDTLTAKTDSLNYNGETAGTLSYQWYRGNDAISGATNSTYTVAADDIDQTIKVEVKNSNNSGSVPSDPTVAVVKKAGPPPLPSPPKRQISRPPALPIQRFLVSSMRSRPTAPLPLLTATSGRMWLRATWL